MRISDWSSDVCSSDLREFYSLLAMPKIGVLTQAWACHCLNFFLGATVLYLLMSAVAESYDATLVSRLLGVLGVYAAAWLLGFLMPGAPAGLGVREVVLFMGLAPLVGGASAMRADEHTSELQ